MGCRRKTPPAAAPRELRRTGTSDWPCGSLKARIISLPPTPVEAGLGTPPAALRNPPHRVAEAAWPPRPALAADPGSLPHLAVGNHAPADPGGDRHPLLPALSRALPRCGRTGRRPAH